MNFIDFVQFVKTQCMYETIYEDSNDNLILVTRMLDAYAMANKMVAAERERLTAAATEAAEKAIDVAMSLEREACANVAEQVGQHKNQHGIAAAIRARGQA